ncbi:hypothetical protein TNCV_3610751 [Trichonephila clavipes]|nr:hypothetical protein TNCV_3610751 [Trichonephila clavipes]
MHRSVFKVPSIQTRDERVDYPMVDQIIIPGAGSLCRFRMQAGNERSLHSLQTRFRPSEFCTQSPKRWRCALLYPLISSDNTMTIGARLCNFEPCRTSRGYFSTGRCSPPTANVSPHFCPSRSPDLSPIDHILANLGCQVGQPRRIFRSRRSIVFTDSEMERERESIKSSSLVQLKTHCVEEAAER